MADLLQPYCEKVFISCREGQQEGIDKNYASLTDNHEGAGPLIGILSAFAAHPNAAWLVVACDLPLLDHDTLYFLVNKRVTGKMATTFKSPFDGLPEPLITIWEPMSFELLKQHIAGGYTCPRKALIRNEALVTLLEPPNPDTLMNANTPEDAAQVRAIIAGRG